MGMWVMPVLVDGGLDLLSIQKHGSTVRYPSDSTITEMGAIINGGILDDVESCVLNRTERFLDAESALVHSSLVGKPPTCFYISLLNFIIFKKRGYFSIIYISKIQMNCIIRRPVSKHVTSIRNSVHK